MTHDLAQALWLLALGPVLASFVTALADRHCAGRPLWAARSHCASCAAPIRARDLVPLWSHARLRGRCRDCGAAIPGRVWGGEWAGLACAVIALLAGGTLAERLLALLFLVLLVGLFQSDRLCFRLPDALTLPLLAVGAALGALQSPLPLVLLAAAVGSGALWLVGAGYAAARGRPGLGLGDVKMMAGLSAAVGLAAIPWVTLLAALLALAAAQLRTPRPSAETEVPFGAALAVAAALVWAAQGTLA